MPSVSNILVVLALAYFGHVAYQVALLWHPSVCEREDINCLLPYMKLSEERFDLHLYTLQKPAKKVELSEQPFWSKTNISAYDSIEEVLQVPLFPDTRKNGSLSLAAVLTQPFYITSTPLTKYQRETYRKETLLLGNEGATAKKAPSGEVVSHWVSSVKLRLVADERRYDRKTIPRDIPWKFFQDTQANMKGKKQEYYAQSFYVDTLHTPASHFRPLDTNTSRPDPHIDFKYIPTSVGSFRLLKQLEASVSMMKELGLGDNEIDEVMVMMSPDHLYRLALTYTISMLHIVFSFLAFKNEIGFWKGRDSYAGLSQRTTVGNAICELIVFLYLYDAPNTSWLVLGTVGVSTIIGFWKVTKVLKMDYRGKRKAKSSLEKETDSYDATGMYYLSLLLWPLVIGWSIYSLFNHAYRSWWSWVINSAAKASGSLALRCGVVNPTLNQISFMSLGIGLGLGVYAFGFLLMTPQIFINYKLKSVAHMPWRAMTYKVFNTFVDDAFAWIIEMPLAHRLATLRDDLVFLVYLYQYYKYPVDKTRANEFGYAYAEDVGKKDEKEEEEGAQEEENKKNESSETEAEKEEAAKKAEKEETKEQTENEPETTEEAEKENTETNDEKKEGENDESASHGVVGGKQKID